MSLLELAASNQTRVNERVVAAGVCVLHNPGVDAPAAHVLSVPIGNDLPLCDPCTRWWLGEWAAGNSDFDWVAVERLVRKVRS